MIEERIPSNIIIKSVYKKYTKYLMNPKYFDTIIDKIINYIQKHPNNYDCLEIEAKLGRFEFKGESVQALEQIQDIFVIPDSLKNSKHGNKFNFNAGINPRDFYLIWDALEQESKLKNSNIEKLNPQVYQDKIYSSNKRQSFLIENGKILKEEVIRKENKDNINVRNNGFDFRITCSEEMKTEIDEKIDKQENERNKFRVSYQLSYYRVDLTISKEGTNGQYSYEVEIELNKLKQELIGQILDEARIDYIKRILDRFLQNIFNLYSVLIQDAIYENSIKEESQSKNNIHYQQKDIDNIFGNYIKENIKKKNRNIK